MTKKSTYWELFLLISRNPAQKTKELKSMGFNEQTIRRYKKYYHSAEQKILERLLIK